MGVEAAEEGGVFGAGFFEAVVGELFDVAVGDVGEGLGGGAGVGGGHVRDAVMDDAFFDVGGMGVGGGPAGFGAATLIDGDIDEDAAGTHAAKHFAVDEFGGFGAGNEDGADEEVDVREEVHEVGFAGVKGVGGVEGDIEEAHAFEVDFEDGDIRAEAGGHAGGVDAGDAAAEDDDFAWQDAGDAAEENAAAAIVFGEVISADDDGHAAGDFGHRFEEREAAFDVDGFVGDGGDLGIEQALGEWFAGGEVEVGEEDLAGAQEGNFAGLRFFDFYDEVGFGEDLLVGGDDLGAGAGVVGVGITGACAGVGFDEDAVAAFDELIGGGGKQRDAEFLIFDFLGHPDEHGRKVSGKR